MAGAGDEEARLEAQRVAIRKIEADIRKALAERDKLKPSGFFGMFGRGGDPAKLEEVEMTLEILKVELADRRRELRTALKAVEEADTQARRDAMLPADVGDAETAARMILALERMEPLLGDLRTMALEATRARAAKGLGVTTGGEYRNYPGRRARMAHRTRVHTEGWERMLDEAEWLADIACFPLALPRRYEAPPRPPHAPRPTPEVKLAREANRIPSDHDFGPALEMVPSQLQQYATQAIHVREALGERFPEARTIAATTELDLHDASAPVAQPKSEDPTDVLLAEWEALRKTYTEICRAVQKRSGTMAFLDPVGGWQRRAAKVRENPVAIEHGLLPPVNESGDLAGFVARVQAEWPDLDARFAAAFGNPP